MENNVVDQSAVVIRLYLQMEPAKNVLTIKL